MRLNGHWLLCPDNIVRPVFRGEVSTQAGVRVQALFLADPGADRTVLSANILTALGSQASSATQELGGGGGHTTAVLVDAVIEMSRDDGGTAVFRGRFAALSDAESLDMSVLGRDISNLFALIIDRPNDLVCLLGQGLGYTIAQQ
jgi:hypothetical protein